MEAITSLKSHYDRQCLIHQDHIFRRFRSLPKIVPPSGKKLLSKFFVCFFQLIQITSAGNYVTCFVSSLFKSTSPNDKVSLLKDSSNTTLYFI